MSDVFGLISNGTNPVPLQGVCVSGSILGRGARVKVAQRFRNEEADALEAVYRFPLPESAAVCGFAAMVGGRRISGSVEEQDKAFELYDDALARGDGAFLLDQERPNIFTLSVGSLPAGAEAVVEIEYVALLDQRCREVRFSLPTTISPRYLPADTPDEDGIPASHRIHPEYAASVPYGLSVEIAVRGASCVESVESPSHPVNITMGQGNGDELTVRFASDVARMDRDFVLTVTQRAKEAAGRVWRSVDERGTWLQLDMALDEADEPESAPAPSSHGSGREVIFVLDCSGSMQGDSISQARRALEVCLRALEKGSRFNVVRFGNTFQSLFPQPREYGEKTLGEALGWLRAVDADLGGTEVLQPLQHVYGAAVPKGVSRSVLLLTDGQVGNEAEVVELVRSHVAGTRFFCVGIGAGPNDHLVRGLARAGGGAAAFIFPGERIEPRVLSLFRQAVSPRISKLQIDWGGADEQAPLEPILLLGEPMSAWARVPRGAAPAGVTVKAEVEGKAEAWQLPVVDAGSGQLPIPTLWARERIRGLEEAHQAGGRGSRQARPKAETWRQEVIALAREFGLSCSLTSWIAIEEREEKDRQTGELVLRKVPVLVTVGWHGVERFGAALSSYVGAGTTPSAPVTTLGLAPADRRPVRGAPGERSSQEPLYLGRPTRSASASGKIIAGQSLRFSAEAFQPDAGGTDTDLLMSVLSLQRVDGGFDLTTDDLKRFGISASAIARAAASAPGDRAEALRVLHTALVLALLEARFADARETWFSTVKKSRAWLKKASADWGPVLEGKTVARWAKAVVVSAASARMI